MSSSTSLIRGSLLASVASGGQVRAPSALLVSPTLTALLFVCCKGTCDCLNRIAESGPAAGGSTSRQELAVGS